VNDVGFFHQFFRHQRASNFQAAGIKTFGAIHNNTVEKEIR